MKITHKKIQAASDYRTFDGLSIDEIEESYPDIFEFYFKDIYNDIEEVYLSKNPNNNRVAILDTDGMYCAYLANGTEGPGWYETTFKDLFDWLK